MVAQLRKSRFGRNGGARLGRRPLRRVVAAAAALLALPFGAAAAASVPEMGLWVTAQGEGSFLARRQLPELQPGVPTGAISLDPGRRYQQIVGFGAAISDSAAHLIQRRLSSAQRQALFLDLFGPAPGANFSLIRLPLGSSDFSSRHYSFNDMPAGSVDPEIRHFSLEAARPELLPTLKAALALNPSLRIIGTPWSAPGWMKSSGSLVAGTLKDEYQQAFATYLRRTLEEFGREGVPIHYVTIQNEPDHEPADYPGMRLSPQQRARIIGQYVGPEFRRAGVRAKLLEWDHNWAAPDQPLAVLADPLASSFISGVAWHCYAGDPAAQSQVAALHPGKDVFFTECSGGEWSPGWAGSFPWTMRNLIVGATRNSARGVLLWNLALDEKHGPRLGGCSNCRGVVTIDSRSGAVVRNAEYYALAHLSRFVPPGSWRIETGNPHDRLLTVGFQTRQSQVLLAFNDAASAVEAVVAVGGSHLRFRLPAQAAATLVLPLSSAGSGSGEPFDDFLLR